MVGRAAEMVVFAQETPVGFRRFQLAPGLQGDWSPLWFSSLGPWPGRAMLRGVPPARLIQPARSAESTGPGS